MLESLTSHGGENMDPEIVLFYFILIFITMEKNDGTI